MQRGDIMTIRPMTDKDFSEVMDIYEGARRFMRENGNATQWVNGHPSAQLVRSDIENGVGYVAEEGGQILAVFALISGDDPTYGTIDGAWRSTQPYATIHRIAARPGHGAAQECIRWAAERCPHLRIDTHRDNKPMLHVIEKCGFVYCGIITIADGTPRMAFERLP